LFCIEKKYRESKDNQLTSDSHAIYCQFLGHLLGDDLINPVQMSVRTYIRTYVRTSTIKLNAATNQIVVFVRVDETFTTISLSGSSEVKVKVT